MNATGAMLLQGGLVIGPLLALGLVALVILLDKAYIYARYVRLPAALEERIAAPEFAWGDLADALRTLEPRNRYGHFLHALAAQPAQPAWWLESRANQAAQQIERSLASGMWVLETIVTAAPLLGLLGTITGMMQAFRLIGGNGVVDPAGVTAGVAEALIATALGLLIALLALFGFNFFMRLQVRTLDELETLGTRLLDQLRLERERAS